MQAGAVEAGTGRLAENIAYFGRALRSAGLPVGPGAVLDAVAAVEAAGIGHRADFHATLQAVFVKKREHMAVFDQAFQIFWRKRSLMERMMAAMMPVAPGEPDKPRQEALRRVSEALYDDRNRAPQEVEQQKMLDARLTVSDLEVFKRRDFEQMSAAEIEEAKRAVARLVLPLDRVVTRRMRADPNGLRVDPRASLRATLRSGAGGIALKFRAPLTVHPPIVALADISGSMSRYAQVFLHFLHALGRADRKVHGFVFATELTNISRALAAHRDPDLALAATARMVRDWDGGTRIGRALSDFNRLWSRRVLGQGAIVLLLTDGLERQETAELSFALDRLRRSCRRLIWLNPLLRYDGFEARAAGIRAMLPHVDEFRSLHNLASMADLCRALTGEPAEAAADPRRFRLPE
ncbi:MAG TPA: VWA domain-containing protein [Beijerinckiaceae bacterium]|nr:VWA domain-containing protein [Beijerinckiaceae bacterium]